MESNYRGDSPSKKQTRVLYWSIIADILGPQLFKKGPYLVISGKEGGDVSTLLAMGVEPSAIHAVDVNKHDLAAAAARFKGSGVQFKRAEFKDAHAIFGMREYACAFIDMCAPIRNDDLDAVIALPAKLKGYEFLLGREVGSVNKFIKSVTRVGQHVTEPRLRYLNHRGFESHACLYYASSTETTLGLTMCLALCAHIRPRTAGQEYAVEEVRLDEAGLRKMMLKDRSKKIVGLYNMPAASVAAIRAWETMRKNKIR